MNFHTICPSSSAIVLFLPRLRKFITSDISQQSIKCGKRKFEEVVDIELANIQETVSHEEVSGEKLSIKDISIWKSFFPSEETEVDPILWQKTKSCKKEDLHLHMINYCFQVKKYRV